MIVQATDEAIRQAAEHIREGRLVGMPTETVYGIAADAMNRDAVRATFAAKGRPADNPLIVHIAHVDQLELVAREVGSSAKDLIERFWPGPLTVVLPKQVRVPSEVTGGLDTVAVRMPRHPVALDLIHASGPISAPSANRFMGLSPTRAENIEASVASQLALILDGGPCEVGVESTVVDCTADWPRILRPGGVSRAEIEAVLGRHLDAPESVERRSPGMYPKHYSPRTPVRIVARLEPGHAGITLDAPDSARQVRLADAPGPYAAALYATLYALDQVGYDVLYVQAPPKTPEWEAVWDRLTRAAIKDV